tara:strand:- start:1427 stop:1642 length:216 start_codon:yes stop_codon:yes gene_type:complete
MTNDFDPKVKGEALLAHLGLTYGRGGVVLDESRDTPVWRVFVNTSDEPYNVVITWCGLPVEVTIGAEFKTL